jgi:hypothetical protein
MAIIKPSNVFDGSDAGLPQIANSYLKDSVKKLVFNKNTNTNGAYLFFLPGYKPDSLGRGVWYKVFEVRDNFGDKFKEKYYVPDKSKDPATYFANQYYILYRSGDNKGIETVTVNGRQFKKYPNYGRITKRCIFNVTYAADPKQGIHVLDLPLVNGAAQLTDWLTSVDMHGKTRPCINDPDGANPVFVQLKDASANPWVINVDTSQTLPLPSEMTDSANLYNLDEVFNHKPAEEIIGKLRELYSGEIFEDCMRGYPGLTSPRGVGMPAGVSTPAAAPSQAFAAPQQQTAQRAFMPPTGEPSAPPWKSAASVPIYTNVDDQDAPFIDPAELPPNPMGRRSTMTREEAQRFLEQ